MAASMEGMDSLVFSAGIGENSALMRTMICDRLAWMGVTLDEEANARNAAIISAPESRIEVRIIPTDEEVILAKQTALVIGEGAHGDAAA